MTTKPRASNATRRLTEQHIDYLVETVTTKTPQEMGIGDREHSQDRWTLPEIKELIFNKFQFSTTLTECDMAVKNADLQILYSPQYQPAHLYWKKSLSKKYIQWKESPEAKAILKTENEIAQKTERFEAPRRNAGIAYKGEEELKGLYQLLRPSHPWITNPKFWTKELLNIKNNKIKL